MNNIIKNDFDRYLSIGVYKYFKYGYKLILLFSALGTFFSAFYLWITPSMYEGHAQINLSEISYFDSKSRLSTILLEEPTKIVVRHSLPNLYTKKEIKDCGFQDNENAALNLSKSIKINSVKGVTNLIEIKFRGTSPEIVYRCIDGIFQKIYEIQKDILLKYQSRLQMLLKNNQIKITQINSLFRDSAKDPSIMISIYISKINELNTLINENKEIESLLEVIKLAEPELVAPIFVNNEKIYPNKSLVLLIGILTGIFCGLVSAFWFSYFRLKKS